MNGEELYTQLDDQLEMDILAAQIESEAAALIKELKYLLPIKTGNLRNDAFKMVKTADGFELYLDEIIAPYVKHPNLKKKLNKIWPQLVQQFVVLLAATIGGTVE
jgi:hypothetical protein